MLGFHVARSESAVEGARVLRDLEERGLPGKSLRIIVGDGGGIKTAAFEVYPWTQFQLCHWHNLQVLKLNASSMADGHAMMKEAARCYYVHDLCDVQHRTLLFMAQWKEQ